MNVDNTYNPIRLNPAEEVAEKRGNAVNHDKNYN